MTKLHKLYELDISENPGIYVDMLLHVISTSEMQSLQSISAAGCSVQNDSLPIQVFDSSENGLIFLKRLDLSGSLTRPEQLNFVTDSPALKSLEFLNLNKCVIDETSF